MSSWITSNWAKELRDLWNQYDPIGVYQESLEESEWPLDEYDSYHGLIIKHLNARSKYDSIFIDVKQLVTERMCLTWNPGLEKITNEFVSNTLEWFETKQPELK